MHGVVKHLGKDLSKCDMCHNLPFKTIDKYLYLTWEMLPKLPQKELTICKKCALREVGSKNKKNFDKIVREKGEKYGSLKETI